MCKIGDVWQFTDLWFMSNLDNILILMLIHPCLQMVSFWQALEYHASRVAVSQQIFFRNTNAPFSWNILYFWILTRHGGRKKTLKRFGTKRIVWKRTSFLFYFHYLYLWNFYPSLPLPPKKKHWESTLFFLSLLDSSVNLEYSGEEYYKLFFSIMYCFLTVQTFKCVLPNPGACHKYPICIFVIQGVKNLKACAKLGHVLNMKFVFTFFTFTNFLTVMIQKARFPSAERPKTCFFDHFSKEKAKYPSAERPFLASKQTSGRIIYS